MRAGHLPEPNPTAWAAPYLKLPVNAPPVRLMALRRPSAAAFSSGAPWRCCCWSMDAFSERPIRPGAGHRRGLCAQRACFHPRPAARRHSGRGAAFQPRHHDQSFRAASGAVGCWWDLDAAGQRLHQRPWHMRHGEAVAPFHCRDPGFHGERGPYGFRHPPSCGRFETAAIASSEAGCCSGRSQSVAHDRSFLVVLGFLEFPALAFVDGRALIPTVRFRAKRPAHVLDHFAIPAPARIDRSS